MGLNTAVLRDSFALVVERQPNLTSLFYDELFSKYPQAQPLFSAGRNGRAKQEQMLTEALVAVMDHLEDAPWLTSTLKGLGAKHKDYGVTREMYDWVGASLLATLAKVAAAEWTPEVEQSWKDAYGAISSLMLSGAE
jgi:hemoglobin-like flavoprotein